MSASVPPPASIDEAAVLAIQRPHPHLFTFYVLRLLVFLPLLPVLILPEWFRYHTMRYRFTDEGISMSWGILFRRQIIVNYARIQDIHLRSNFVERWFGLARVLVQTASGNSGAELTIEGLKEFEAIRDFLYSKMRGVNDQARPASAAMPRHESSAVDDVALAAALREVAHELRATRLALEAQRQANKNSGDV